MMMVRCLSVESVAAECRVMCVSSILPYLAGWLAGLVIRAKGFYEAGSEVVEKVYF